MSLHKSYAVFGLGRYGFSVAKELAQSGADILAVDSNQSLVDEAIDFIPICKCADVTDPDVIKALGISSIDIVIIAMANNLEASVLATTLCKEAGVKTVIVKCADEMHQKILSRVGADKVVIPEKESGVRLAKNLLSSGFVDLVELSNNLSMVEIDVKDSWVGKSLLELNLRKKYSLNVIAIRQQGKASVDINPTAPLEKNMSLIVIADTARLNKLNN
ncbi:MAG: TrkA family potassium uptake protein [Ruminococcaceae bacterium]|nr:TrkA family potassium uptake protein [Oscillospiraceae bacterium]